MSGLRGTIHDRRETEALQRLAGERGGRPSAAVLQRQAEALEAIIAASLRNLDATQAVLTEAQQELEVVQQDQGNLAGRLTAAEGDITALSSSLSTLSGDLTALSEDLTALAGTVSALRAAAAAVSVPALASADITDPPDETDYNDLRADVAALRQAVLDLKGAVS